MKDLTRITLPTPIFVLAFVGALTVISLPSLVLCASEPPPADDATDQVTIDEAESGETETGGVDQETADAEGDDPSSDDSSLVTWTHHHEVRLASDTEICTVYHPSITFGVRFVRRQGRLFKAVQVGRSLHNDAYLRLTFDDGPGAPLKIEDGVLIRPATGDRLTASMKEAVRVDIEWTMGWKATVESASLEGFEEAYDECVEVMGGGFD